MRIEFIIPANLCLEDIQSTLQKNNRILTEPSQTVCRTYYDSFDWRLYLNDSLLEDTRDGNEHTVVWRTLKGEPCCPPLKLRDAPRFVRELPPGQFRSLLGPVLEMRELAPRVRIRSRVHKLRILNKDEKTVARLLIGENSLPRQQGTRAVKLDNRATLVPVKGYPKPCRAIANHLEQLGLTVEQDDIMLAALSIIGATPGNYSSKLDLTL
ncbi:MAG: hypothetical protein OEU51_06840, partial [Gammaproteobacteria bacterium]|nr:hypothetical protein [Gammaproteobacteria bacterium]